MELLMKTCKYISIVAESSGITENVETRIATKVLEGNMTDDQIAFVEEIFKDSHRMEYVKQLITPVSDKNWTTEWTTPTSYHPVSAPLDNTSIYDMNVHYIYIHSEVQGRWGETYWISDNNTNILNSLPVIKVFKEYDFKVGHFYKLVCTDIIHWGDNKKKYLFDIAEISEEEYMTNSFDADAWENGFYDKIYMDQMVKDWEKRNK